MGERIAWMMSSRSDTFAINLKYTDIKSQKISPEGKAKIQLQVGSTNHLVQIQSDSLITLRLDDVSWIKQLEMK